MGSLTPELCAETRSLSVGMDALCCLPRFSNLQKLVLRPGEIRPGSLAYLYGIQIRTLLIDYVSDEIDDYTLDLSGFPALELLNSRTAYNFKHADRCKTLRTLRVQNWAEPDLVLLRHSAIAAVSITGGKLRSLHGIEECGLLSLSLSCQRRLSDISALTEAAGLERLEIDRCPKIDLEALPPLPALEYLALYGSQNVQSLAFLGRFPRLRRFLFDIAVEDGDLSPLSKLSHCVSLIDRKHYNRKDRELPKSDAFCFGRLPERLEILPG